MKYAKIINDKVDTIYHYEAEGAEQIPDDVFAGFIKNADGTFTNPNPPVDNSRRDKIYTRLAQIDRESIRPLRAKLNGTNTQDDDDALAALETEAQALRDELAAL